MNNKKTTNEKPVSLSPLDFEKALKGLVEVESDPCWKEQQAFNDAIEELLEAGKMRVPDVEKIQKAIRENPDYKPEEDPLIVADKKLSKATLTLVKCRKQNGWPE